MEGRRRSLDESIAALEARKVQYDDLRQDPNTKVWVCESCVDLYDPWRLPARNPENISLDHPRPDSDMGFPPFTWNTTRRDAARPRALPTVAPIR